MSSFTKYLEYAHHYLYFADRNLGHGHLEVWQNSIRLTQWLVEPEQLLIQHSSFIPVHNQSALSLMSIQNAIIQMLDQLQKEMISFKLFLGLTLVIRPCKSPFQPWHLLEMLAAGTPRCAVNEGGVGRAGEIRGRQIKSSKLR